MATDADASAELARAGTALQRALEARRESGDAGPVELAARAYARFARQAGMEPAALVAEFRRLYDAVLPGEATDFALHLQRERWVTRLIALYTTPE